MSQTTGQLGQGTTHEMRNEMTASMLYSTKQLQEPSWSQHLLVGDRVEIPLPHRKPNSTEDGLEPLRLRVHLVAHLVGGTLSHLSPLSPQQHTILVVLKNP